MKTIFTVFLIGLAAVPAFAAPAYPLDALLVRAKFVCIAEATAFDGTNVSLKVESWLHGDLGAGSLTFKVETDWGKPEKGSRYFVFSQGHDHWGNPKDDVKLSQDLDCQGSYCGWLMLPIQKDKEAEIVKNAFSFKFRKPEEGIGPLTLDQAKQLVRETAFKEDNNRTPNNLVERHGAKARRGS